MSQELFRKPLVLEKLDEVLGHVEQHTSFTRADLLGNSPGEKLVKARQVAMTTLWMLGFTQLEVATAFGHPLEAVGEALQTRGPKMLATGGLAGRKRLPPVEKGASGASLMETMAVCEMTWEQIHGCLAGRRREIWHLLATQGPMSRAGIAPQMQLREKVAAHYIIQLKNLGFVECVGKEGHGTRAVGIYRAVPVEEARERHLLTLKSPSKGE